LDPSVPTGTLGDEGFLLLVITSNRTSLLPADIEHLHAEDMRKYADTDDEDLETPAILQMLNVNI